MPPLVLSPVPWLQSLTRVSTLSRLFGKSSLRHGLRGVVLLLALSGCSKNTGTSIGKSGADNIKKSKTPANPATGKFVITDKWKINSKLCNGESADVDAGEGVKLDPTHLIRVITESDNETQICRLAFMYDRVIQSAGMIGVTYTELSTVHSDSMTRSCYRKIKGHIKLPAESTTKGSFEAEKFAAHLQLSSNQLTLLLDRPTDCPAGTLQYNLSR